VASAKSSDVVSLSAVDSPGKKINHRDTEANEIARRKTRKNAGVD